MAQKSYVGAARAFTNVQLGGPTTELESNPTVQNTAGIILQGNPDRVGLVFINTSTVDVFIAFNSGVSSTNGIKIGANGNSVTMTVRDDFTLPTRTIYAITSSGTATVYILEVVRQIYTPDTEK